MSLKKYIKTNFLKHTVNAIWYASLALGIFLFVAVIVFDVAVVTQWNIKFPTTTIQMNDHIYKFNSKYLEVKRLNSIISSFMGKEFFKETLKKSSVHL